MLSIWRIQGEGTCVNCCKSKAYPSCHPGLPFQKVSRLSSSRHLTGYVAYARFKFKHNAEGLTELVCSKYTLLKTTPKVLVTCWDA